MSVHFMSRALLGMLGSDETGGYTKHEYTIVLTTHYSYTHTIVSIVFRFDFWHLGVLGRSYVRILQLCIQVHTAIRLTNLFDQIDPPRDQCVRLCRYNTHSLHSWQLKIWIPPRPSTLDRNKPIVNDQKEHLENLLRLDHRVACITAPDWLKSDKYVELRFRLVYLWFTTVKRRAAKAPPKRLTKD